MNPGRKQSCWTTKIKLVTAAPLPRATYIRQRIWSWQMNPHSQPKLSLYKTNAQSSVFSPTFQSPSFHSSCLELCQWKPIEVQFPVINITGSPQLSADSSGFLWLLMPFLSCSSFVLFFIFFFWEFWSLPFSLLPLLQSLVPTLWFLHLPHPFSPLIKLTAYYRQ